nr:YkgJ family cysteine cluster protein [Candidatus Sigynarchaeota archaeon]
MTKNKSPKRRRSAYIENSSTRNSDSTVSKRERGDSSEGKDFKHEIDSLRDEMFRSRLLKETFNIVHIGTEDSSNLNELKKIIEKEGRDIKKDVQLQGELRGIYDSALDSESPLCKEMEKIQGAKSTFFEKFKQLIQESKEEIIAVDCNNCGKCCCNENISPAVTIYDLAVYLNLFRHESVNILKDLTIFRYRDTKMKGKEFEGFLPTFRKEEGKCIHYQKGVGCAIYKYRPIDCRIYPGLSTAPELELMECPCEPTAYRYFNDTNITEIGSSSDVVEYIKSNFKNSAIWELFMQYNREIISRRPAYFWQLLSIIASDLSIHELSQRLEGLFQK